MLLGRSSFSIGATWTGKRLLWPAFRYGLLRSPWQATWPCFRRPSAQSRSSDCRLGGSRSANCSRGGSTLLQPRNLRSSSRFDLHRTNTMAARRNFHHKNQISNITEIGMKKVLLLGMGPTALSALESLAEQFHVVGVVRQARNGADADDMAVRRALELSVPVLSDISVNGVQEAIEESQPDCTVVSSYNRILNPRILSRGKFVNVHYSALPKYRGRANVNWAILNREAETAITIHAIAPGLDNGNILFQQAIAIGPEDTVADIYRTLNEIQH